MTTDELIETLERLDSGIAPIMRGRWLSLGGVHPAHHGRTPLEARIETDTDAWIWFRLLEHDVELLLTLRNHLPALISALKENKRLREELAAALQPQGEK